MDGSQAIDAIETAAGGDSAPARPRVTLTEWAALRDAAADNYLILLQATTIAIRYIRRLRSGSCRQPAGTATRRRRGAARRWPR